MWVKEEKEEEPSLTVRDLTVNWLESTSAHGLPRVVTEKSLFRKIVWGLIFVAAFFYFALQAQTFFVRFFAYEVTSTTAIMN